jgi:CheY-like chemotaxis protein
MEGRHKILLLDDDADVLEIYREILLKLPSQPEVHTATAGARAMALLEAEPFRLLICDLHMPKMDGLQVLSIVRRRFPELRTVVMTAMQDEEFRSRAYALGVDLFWLKPETQQNMQMFLECIESLLGRDSVSGFRGVQSKSLLDILQMEAISQASTLLRITRGKLVGKIWMENGELIDAEAEGACGEPAFRRILEWKSGTFESLSPELGRERTIHKPINALLLETAQAIDETQDPEMSSAEEAQHRKTVRRLSVMNREGAEWVVSTRGDGSAPEACATQGAAEVSKWMQFVSKTCDELSGRLDAGPLSHIQFRTVDRRLVLLPTNEKTFLAAFPSDSDPAQSLEKTKHLVASWDS